MSNSANVQSTEAIEAMRRYLVSFAEQVSNAIVTLDLELRRVVEWVEHDRPRHWKTQIRLAGDALHEAQSALHRCLMFPKTVSDRPACYEERQAVAAAQARVQYCYHKAERVKHWKRALPHELAEYQGRISRLTRIVEFEVPQAIALLEKILRHIEAYSAVRVGPAQASYNEVALAEEVWPEKQPETPGEVDPKAASAVELPTQPTEDR